VPGTAGRHDSARTGMRHRSMQAAGPQSLRYKYERELRRPIITGTSGPRIGELVDRDHIRLHPHRLVPNNSRNLPVGCRSLRRRSYSSRTVPRSCRSPPQGREPGKKCNRRLFRKQILPAKRRRTLFVPRGTQMAASRQYLSLLHQDGQHCLTRHSRCLAPGCRDRPGVYALQLR
jgi:hypothetical protein